MNILQWRWKESGKGKNKFSGKVEERGGMLKQRGNNGGKGNETMIKNVRVKELEKERERRG